MTVKVLSNTYVIIGRFIAKARVKLVNNVIEIKPSHAFIKTIRMLRSSLSTSEIRQIASVSGLGEYIVGIEDIREIFVRQLRRDRKDILGLFDEDIKNIYEVVLITNALGDIKLIMPQNEYLKLKDFISKSRK